ncbi:MAG: triose-phosphate isomerase [Thermoplasmata archaeon]|nr:MAG: triose-phosphate isomerase [Thermoplasmata archaeon]
MDTPVIVINVKTYKEGTGEKALELARCIEKVGKEIGIEMAIAVQPTDIYAIYHETNIPVFAQHIDAIKYGSNTGWILPEAVKEAGAVGTLLNHSEHPIPLENICKGIERAKELQMETIVCAGNVDMARAIAALSPHFVAIEPPELIGGDVSVTTAEPDVVRNAVDAVKKIDSRVKVLCGAGVKKREDVRKAIELGTDGVLLASGVVKAKDKEAVLMDLAKGIERL